MPPTSEFTLHDPVRAGKRVLVVDPDYDTLAALAGALRSRGLEVFLAADGRTGLERAAGSSPDVILVDVRVPLIDIRTFLEVLKGNPRTASVPVFLMGPGDASRIPYRESREGAFGKPFQVDEVAARIEGMLADRTQAKEAGTAAPEVRGDLAQVPLADILQVFSMNRRTGTFQLAFPSGASGEVGMSEGEVIDARFGPAFGMKALVRLLAETGGHFHFVPQRVPRAGTLQGSTEALLVEALRQQDELARLAPELPPKRSIVYVPPNAREDAPADEASLGVLALAAEPRSIETIFDRAPMLDVETALVVAALLRSGRLAVRSEGSPGMPLAAPSEMVTLRGRVLRARRVGVPGPPRLLVPMADLAALGNLHASISSIADFAAEALPIQSGTPLGSLGMLRLGEGAEIEVFVIPEEPRLRPIWFPFTAAAVGALLFASTDRDSTRVRDTARFLREEAFVPVCVTAWRGGWGSSFEEGDVTAEGIDTPEGAAGLLREVLARLGT